MNNIYEAELNLEWWNSKSPAYQKRYLTKHPNSIYADAVKSGELKVDEEPEKVVEKPSKIDSKRAKTLERIKANQEYLDKIYPKYQEALNEYRKIPLPIRTWDHDHYVYDSPADEENAKRREELVGRVRSMGAEVDRVKHNIDVANRYLLRLHRQENFEARQATPNSTTKYKDEGIAEVVDFSGMDKESEDAAISAVAENIKRYPFMKGHLSFLGSHKSSKFRQLSDQLAHDFYLDSVEKTYNSAKETVAKYMTGYIGKEKVPSRAYQDESNWISEQTRDSLRYHLFEVNQAYDKISNIDARGGPEGYIQTPSYQNAINRWKRMKSRNWAFYRPNSLKDNQEGLIAFNENKFDDAEMERMVEIKWHPEGCATKKATMDHEFGHAIWYKLGLDKVGKPGLNGANSLGQSPLQSYIAHEMYMGRNSVKNGLSEYAATNSSEFFAEAYSEYLNNPNPRPIARKVGELLDQEIELRGYKK